jgi:hypothetical protein
MLLQASFGVVRTSSTSGRLGRHINSPQPTRPHSRVLLFHLAHRVAVTGNFNSDVLTH